MSNVHPLLPKLTVNRQFIQEFIAVESPCFALGLVEERKQTGGFFALRPSGNIPAETGNRGFRFGHTLLGNADFEIIQFIFEFYGFETYSVLLNPNNPLVQRVLTTMVENEDYFFLAINANQTVTAFRSDIGSVDLAGLKTNLQQILNSTTTDLQYLKALSTFEGNPQPASQVLNWVCQDRVEYLDLTQHRLELNPS